MSPRVDDTAFVAPGTHLIGQVCIGARSSVWFGSVLRGDVGGIRIGRETNIQDHCVLHTRQGVLMEVGDRVTLGHRVTAHACRIKDDVLVGVGSIVLDDVVIPSRTLVGAGSLVPPGRTLEPQSLYMGLPVEKVRDLKQDDLEAIQRTHARYIDHVRQYQSSL